MVRSDLATQAVGYGIATEAELVEIADGWRAWGAADDAVSIDRHGELPACG